MSFPPGYRPKLASKARLVWDRREGKELLLYPERGLLLNEVAGTIARWCDGTRTTGALVGELGARYPEAAADDLARDVDELLEQLAERGLLVAPGTNG